MPEVKLVVIYPRPRDVAAFEKAYHDEHLPMAMEKLKGVTKFVATKVRRTIFRLNGIVASLCGFRWRKRDRGPCHINFHRWASDHNDRGRAAVTL